MPEILANFGIQYPLIRGIQARNEMKRKKTQVDYENFVFCPIKADIVKNVGYTL